MNINYAAQNILNNANVWLGSQLFWFNTSCLCLDQPFSEIDLKYNDSRKNWKKYYAYGKLNHQSQTAVWHVMFDFYPIQSKFDRCRMPDDRFESKWFYGYLLSKKLKTVLLYRVKKILRLFSH